LGNRPREAGNTQGDTFMKKMMLIAFGIAIGVLAAAEQLHYSSMHLFSHNQTAPSLQSQLPFPPCPPDCVR